ncbi:MAG: flagellar biosynthesis protein FliQ [Alphaproteobacteria bacterium]
MDPAAVIDVARDGIIVMLKVATPIMLSSLVVGLVISLLQALTQIQEMTLTFVPKIVTIFAVIIIILPFISQTLGNFGQEVFSYIQRI